MMFSRLPKTEAYHHNLISNYFNRKGFFSSPTGNFFHAKVVEESRECFSDSFAWKGDIFLLKR